MSERKVLNKYYPPDFDPSKIPRRRGPKNKQQVVRLMAPFSMRCNTCGEYVYKGKKFNARKETVEGEDYYGIKIFRFYIKCPLCSAEITFKTDPKNTDYVAEHGAARNYESWREEVDLDEPEDKLAKMEEEENNPMKALETRTLDSKREMDIMDALQDVRARNARHERLVKGLAGDPDALLKRLELEEVDSEEEEERERKRREDEEDDRIVQEVFSKVPLEGGEGSKTIKRKADSDAPDLASLLTRTTAVAVKPPAAAAPPPAKKLKTGATVNSLGIKIVKKKKVAA